MELYASQKALADHAAAPEFKRFVDKVGGSVGGAIPGCRLAGMGAAPAPTQRPRLLLRQQACGLQPP